MPLVSFTSTGVTVAIASAGVRRVEAGDLSHFISM
jgi:hypothetical protein